MKAYNCTCVNVKNCGAEFSIASSETRLIRCCPYCGNNVTAFEYIDSKTEQVQKAALSGFTGVYDSNQCK